MKLIVNIFAIFFIALNFSVFAEIKDCGQFKKFSKKHVTCMAGNLKTGTKNTVGKIKKKTGNILKVTSGN
tara:strand:+ start:360 stop:569 length:210 start_codon:yes stop_codon:yes gene_type:complete